MRFQAAVPDARAVVYAGIQSDPLVARVAGLLVEAKRGQMLLARAVMNGERGDPDVWRSMFPALFRGPDAETSETILAASLEVADRGDEARNQFRGAIVEHLTQLLLARRVPPAAVQRERRVLFDGVRAQVHPYDVTVELSGHAEVYDCKWGARGINVDVLEQLDEARTNAEAEGGRVMVGLVIFDARRSCEVRVSRLTAPGGRTRVLTIETIQKLGRRAVPATPSSPSGGAPGSPA